MRTRIQTSLIVAALLAGGGAGASGQNPAIDARWIAYLGCWQQVEIAQSVVCVVPAGTSAVDLLTIVKGQVVARVLIDPNGQRVETARDDCTAWQRAEWSARGPRLYLHSGDQCAGGLAHSGTGVIAMTGAGEWLYIQGMTLGDQTGVRVQRYRELASDVALPDDVVMNALRHDVAATMQARAAASAPLAIEDVIDASRYLDAAVLEAWLIERREPFTLDAKHLMTLADARVPPRVIDLMVALTYPKFFAINPTSRVGERLASTTPGAPGAPTDYGIAQPYPLCSTFYPVYLDDCAGPYGGYGYPFGYAYGWYPGGYATVVYVGSGGGAGRSHGRVVNGQGYREGDAGVETGALPRAETGNPSAPSGGARSSPSPSVTPSSGEQRTAHPRPQ